MVAYDYLMILQAVLSLEISNASSMVKRVHLLKPDWMAFNTLP